MVIKTVQLPSVPFKCYPKKYAYGIVPLGLP